MLLKRERSIVSSAIPLLPAPLPSLRDALQRRAAVFGPFDLDEPPTPSRGTWQALGDLARRVSAKLDPSA